MRQRIAQRPLTVILLLLIFLLVLALVWVFFEQRRSDAVLPVGRVTPTTTDANRQVIVIEAPQAGTNVSSPFEVRGRTAFYPFEGSLVYRVYDAGGALVGTGPFQAQGEYGGPATFATPITYTLAAEGPGRVEVVEFSAADGSVRAAGTVSLTLQASGAPQPEVNQEIVIDTPPPGTQVGSPVVITGRTARLPTNGQLAYQITSGNVLLGGGVFGVATSDTGATFNASLSFNVPVQGGPVRVEIVERNPLDQSVIASAGIDLTVAPQQQGILIESPPVGTTVGSPVVITGRTQQFPLQGSLAYRVVDAFGQQIGVGSFPVQGSPGQPASFNASLTFALPPQGGPVRVEIFDQDAQSGTVVSTTSISLFVAPQPAVTPLPPTAQPATPVPPTITPPASPTVPPPPTTPVPPPETPVPLPAPQQIVIETPPQGTTVGSPVVITGRTTYLPNEGNLNYRVVDDRNTELGAGSITVTAAVPNGATFNASLTFNEPPAGGLIRVEIFDTNEADGSIIARATINLLVAPPPVPTETVVPLPAPVTPPPYPAPAPSPRTVGAQDDAQQIVIDSPVAGQSISNPLTVYGRVARRPTNGELAYRVLDANGAIVTNGRFVVGDAPSAPISFVTEIAFAAAPPPGVLTLEVFEPAATRADNTRASVQVTAS